MEVFDTHRSQCSEEQRIILARKYKIVREPSKRQRPVPL